MNPVFLALFFSLIFSLIGCERTTPLTEKSRWEEIFGRDEGPLTGKLDRSPIYRAKVPVSWKKILPSQEYSIYDTTLPLCEFVIGDKESCVTLVIHNFPCDNISQRIPPQAQITRWKKQFETFDASSSHLLPQAYGGFAGLFLEGRGIYKGAPKAIMGWAMQLAKEHFHQLQKRTISAERKLSRQMCADYTIKAVGTPESILKYREDIVTFARSFELVQEIPAPL